MQVEKKIGRSENSYWLARYREASQQAAKAPSGLARRALDEVARHCLALHLQSEKLSTSDRRLNAPQYLPEEIGGGACGGRPR